MTDGNIRIEAQITGHNSLILTGLKRFQIFIIGTVVLGGIAIGIDRLPFLALVESGIRQNVRRAQLRPGRKLVKKAMALLQERHSSIKTINAPRAIIIVIVDIDIDVHIITGVAGTYSSICRCSWLAAGRQLKLAGRNYSK